MTQTITAAELKAPARSKYGAKRTEFRGEWYDSKAEARVAEELHLRTLAGELVRVERQVPIQIVWPGGPTICTIRVDFRLTRADGAVTLLEVKGYRVRDWPVKEKLLRAAGWKLEVRGLATRRRKVGRKPSGLPKRRQRSTVAAIR